MADRSYAARRNDAHLVTDFPAQPVLDAEHPCHGLVLIGSDADDVPKLRAVRDRVAAIWSGVLAGADVEEPVLIVLFSAPANTAQLRLGRALPLSSAQGRMLTSFQTISSLAQSPQDAASPRQLDLWWGGKRHRIALDGMARVPVTALWDMPVLFVHAPFRAEATPRAQIARTGVQSDTGQPGQADIPISGEAGISFGDALDRDAALDERTSLKSIGAQLWRRLTGTRTIGGRGADGEGGEAEPQGPGVLANMAGWLLWHTPIGIPLAKQFAERMRLVERLMASGDVDSALRLALRLGASDPGQRAKKNYPLRLPGMRLSLDFNISSSGSAPIIAEGSFFSLHKQYNDLAARLERDGDFKRAAYIRAQLQGYHLAAVETLARGELYLDAAKLAVDAKLPPVHAIELFYKAGEQDTALALAKRAECFDQLAERSRKKEPEFHAYVMRAWTDRLIETGQPLRALQVTDALAGEPNADAALLAKRLNWIDRALDDAPAGSPSPDAVVRALLSSPWQPQDQSLTAFATHGQIAGSEREAVALSALQDWIAQSPDTLRDRLASLFRLSSTHSPEQASFWSDAAPLVMERFALAMIAGSEGRLGQNEKDSLQTLLRRAGSQVLAADIGKLKLQGGGPMSQQAVWTLPPATAQSSRAVTGCILPNDTMLVWRESGLLQLLDAGGRNLWQGQLTDVCSLVPIGAGIDVIIVQRTAQGYQLTRFATGKRAFHSIGSANLTAWHDITSDGQWLVQIGAQIGALDLSKLCAARPELEFLWSCKLTANVQVISFLHASDTPAWLTRDVSETPRRGLIEAWSLQNGRTLQTFLVTIQPTLGRDHSIKVRQWAWSNCYHFMPADSAGWAIKSALWTDAGERQAVAQLEKERRDKEFCADRFVSNDRSRATIEHLAATQDANPGIKSTLQGKHKRVLTITYPPESDLSSLARGVARANSKADTGDLSHLMLFAAQDGRLLHVDLESLKVMVI
jgi:hypothetical protein